jgi:ABC-type branched-subunit amino acid transport system substrate-binding protein
MEKPPAAEQTALARPQSVGNATSAETPYARVGEEPITFAGPHAANISTTSLNIVLFGQHAEQVAHSPQVERVISGAIRGRTLRIVPVDSAQNWGAASTQLVHALIDDHALAIVALDRDAAHLAEQLALKSFVPVLAVSDDKSLTSTNVPWIFRLPAATTPAEAMRVLVTAAAQSGPNPECLRDVLAAGNAIAGIAFLPTGEPQLP